MRVPLQITLRDGLLHSDAVESHLREKADKLQHYFENIIACRVVIEQPNKKHQHGNLHDTHITLTVPGKELVSKHNEHENMYTSIQEAFDDMTRQLEDYVAQMRGETRNPQMLLSGKIVRLFPSDGFGFIEGLDGTEFYFNAQHVSEPAFHHLTIGMPVHFLQGDGTEGPEAHKVRKTTEE